MFPSHFAGTRPHAEANAGVSGIDVPKTPAVPNGFPLQNLMIGPLAAIPMASQPQQVLARKAAAGGRKAAVKEENARSRSSHSAGSELW